MNDKQEMILSWVVIVLMLVMAAALFYFGSNPAPMTGTVTQKLYYPEYAWPSDDMPWEYAIRIDHKDGKQACMWYVDKAVYERHELGDQIVRGWW